MVQATGAPIAEYFAALDDPRIDRTKRHKLLDIVTIALCATICGADSWVDIELFGNCKEEWFKSFLELPNGIPSHDTFGDVFARLDPEQFQPGIPQIKPPFLDIAPAGIPPNIIPHSKGVKCGLMRPDSLKVPAFIGQPLYCQA